jgi:hypothetical protein
LHLVSEATDCYGGTVYNQTDADNQFRGCTSLGWLNIDTGYRGTLVLPGIVNINGSLRDALSDQLYLSAIALPDLESIDAIDLREAPALELVDFPSLVSAASIYITAHRPLNLSLPSLKRVEDMKLNGNFSEY